MKECLQTFVPRLTLICILFSFSPSLRAQWVKKADALKPRSELAHTVVYNSKIYNFVGYADEARTGERTSEVYDPATNKWTYIASVPAGTVKTHQGTLLIDNTVWQIGGRVGKNPGPLTASIWIYNISTNTWSQGPDILDPATGSPLPIAGSGVVLVGRTIHIFGGFTPTACTNDQDKYHLTLDVDTWLSNKSQPAQWKNVLAPMPMKRCHVSAVVLGGKIYSLGGQLDHDCGGAKEVNYCHVYDLATDTWSQLPSLPTGRSHNEGSTFAIDGKIYMVGGQGSDGKSTTKVTIFDPAGNGGAGTWTENTSLALPKTFEGMSAAVIGSTFVIAHGSINSSKYPQKSTYTRTITRNPVYKLGFPQGCLNLTDYSENSIKGHTWLYTIDGNKNYTITSSESWLEVTKNATGLATPNTVEIELTANPAGLTPGNYTAILTATGTGSGANYTPATLCVNLSVQQTTQPWIYDLVVTSNGNGSVSKNPDKTSYSHGSTVILTATPHAGQQFMGWSGDTTGTSNPLTLKMNGDKTVSANFAPLPQYSLALSVNGNGTAAANPHQATYTSGSTVTLTATPAAGQQFTGWSGSVTGNVNPISVIMNGPKNITANFAPLPQYSLTLSVNGNGTAGANPNQATYTSGSTVTLTATPAAGQQFTGWSGSVTGNTNPLAVTMDGPKNIVANFAAPPSFTITGITSTTGLSYVLGNLVAGGTFFSDRDYLVISFPASFTNVPMIKTPNSDKSNKSTTLFSFNINQPATVYVVYDPRVKTLPTWLKSWQKTGEKIYIQDPAITYMELYSKVYPAGKVSLGGNLASPAAGALSNYFVAVKPQSQARGVNYNDVPAGNAGNLPITINAGTGFKVYPNPNPGDRVRINLNGHSPNELVRITLFDAMGKIIQSKTLFTDVRGTGSMELLLKGIHKGFYIIRTQGNTSNKQAKLLIN